MAGKKIFISYSRHDTEYVSSLVEALRKQGFDVWFDKNIRTGVDWDDAIEAQLKSADAIVLVLSKTSVASDNVKDEISYAMGLGKQVNPIKIEECEVPMRLARKQFVDFTAMGNDAGFERLVNDIRKNLEISDAAANISKGSFVPPKASGARSNPVTKRSKKIIPYLIGGIVAILLFVVFIKQFVDDPMGEQNNPDENAMENSEPIWEEDSITNVNTNPNGFDEEIVSSDPDNTEENEAEAGEEERIAGSDPAWEKALKINSIDGYLEYLKHMPYDVDDQPAIDAILALMPNKGVVRFYERDSTPYFARMMYRNPIGELTVGLDKNVLEYGRPGDILVTRNFIEFVWDIFDNELIPNEHIKVGEKVFVLKQDFKQPKYSLRIAYPNQ